MVRGWLSRLVNAIEARQDRALRHAYAPRLEAFREIQQLPEARAKKPIPFRNLQVSRQRTEKARRWA